MAQVSASFQCRRFSCILNPHSCVFHWRFALDVLANVSVLPPRVPGHRPTSPYLWFAFPSFASSTSPFPPVRSLVRRLRRHGRRLVRGFLLWFCCHRPRRSIHLCGGMAGMDRVQNASNPGSKGEEKGTLERDILRRKGRKKTSLHRS